MSKLGKRSRCISSDEETPDFQESSSIREPSRRRSSIPGRDSQAKPVRKRLRRAAIYVSDSDDELDASIYEPYLLRKEVRERSEELNQAFDESSSEEASGSSLEEFLSDHDDLSLSGDYEEMNGVEVEGNTDDYDDLAFLTRNELREPDFEDYCRLLGSYIRHRQCMPEVTTSWKGRDLGVWYRRICRKVKLYRDNRLISRLSKIHPKVHSNLDTILHQVGNRPFNKILAIKEFISYENRRPEVGENMGKRKRVGVWYSELKSLVRDGAHGKILKEMMDSPIMAQDLAESFQQGYLPIHYDDGDWEELLRQYRDQFGKYPTAAKRYKEANLGAWLKGKREEEEAKKQELLVKEYLDKFGEIPPLQMHDPHMKAWIKARMEETN